MDTNVLYYGDNLRILREYIPDASVDLVYLDPPFNSNRDYNVIFKDESGRRSDAQLLAFEDTWHWGPSAEQTYAYLTNTARHQGRVPSTVCTLIAALRVGIGQNQMLAYLVEMTARLVELHRILKPTGSLYLHCDPTASHYLRIVLDAIFGPTNFRNEVIWKRTTAHSGAKKYSPVHDTVFYYGKSATVTWNEPRVGYEQAYLNKYYRFDDGDGRLYWRADLCAAGVRKGRSGVPWRGIDPAVKGMHWKFTVERLEELDREGRIYWPKNGIMPQYKRYRDELKGKAVPDIWDDIDRINPVGTERLGYPTQKPVALLERVIAASSDPGQVVLDAFCGCGTAIVAAHKLGRRWIGIDITYLAISVMRARMKEVFGLEAVDVIGQPTEVQGARALAQQEPDGRWQFQWWALSLIDARPLGGIQKKGADRGIDGVITFTGKNGKFETVVVSVKSGRVARSMVGELRGTVEREQAAIGIFITLQEPTREMRLEADRAGLYTDPWGRDHPKLQILTVRELLEEGKRPSLPPFAMPAYPPASRIPVAVGVEQQTFLSGDKDPSMLPLKPEDAPTPTAQPPAATSSAAPRNRRSHSARLR